MYIQSLTWRRLVRAWSCLTVRGRAWSVVRGRSFVVVRGCAWSCVVVRGGPWSCAFDQAAARNESKSGLIISIEKKKKMTAEFGTDLGARQKVI